MALKHTYTGVGVKFNTDFLHRSTPNAPARHGMVWERSEERMLGILAREGRTLELMCQLLERSAGSLIAKLVSMGLITQDEFDDEYYFTTAPSERQPKSSTPTQEPTMAQAPNIESKTFIAGREASGMTDREVFNRIAELEAEITFLGTILVQSKTLDKLIKATRKDIKALAEYVDGRN